MTLAFQKRRFTVEEFYRMADAGILGENNRVELIEGEVFEMTPIGSRHAACVKRLHKLLERRLGDQALVSVQDPIRISQTAEPQPDIALLKPRADFYAQAHPTPQDVLLVVEVADASLDYDRRVKLPLYARAGIPHAWLVDLAERCLEVHQDPSPRGYRAIQKLGLGKSVTLLGAVIDIDTFLAE